MVGAGGGGEDHIGARINRGVGRRDAGGGRNDRHAAGGVEELAREQRRLGDAHFVHIASEEVRVIQIEITAAHGPRRVGAGGRNEEAVVAGDGADLGAVDVELEGAGAGVADGGDVIPAADRRQTRAVDLDIGVVLGDQFDAEPGAALRKVEERLAAQALAGGERARALHQRVVTADEGLGAAQVAEANKGLDREVGERGVGKRAGGRRDEAVVARGRETRAQGVGGAGGGDRGIGKARVGVGRGAEQGQVAVADRVERGRDAVAVRAVLEAVVGHGQVVRRLNGDGQEGDRGGGGRLAGGHGGVVGDGDRVDAAVGGGGVGDGQRGAGGVHDGGRRGTGVGLIIPLIGEGAVTGGGDAQNDVGAGRVTGALAALGNGGRGINKIRIADHAQHTGRGIKHVEGAVDRTDPLALVEGEVENAESRPEGLV